jgi:cysteine dioxygenase
MERALSLFSLIRTLKDEAPNIGRLRMKQILTQVVITGDELASYGRFNVDEYARNLVYSDENMEIFLMCWRSGQRSLVHDHGESLGGVKILRGILTERLFEQTSNGMIKLVSTTDYQSGDVQIEDHSTIHQVSNLQSGHYDATSLHVYLPPLVRIKSYRLYDMEIRSISAELHGYGSGI